MLSFEVTKIANGWELKGSWIDPGGGDYPARPRSETLYCKDLNILANTLVIFAQQGFEVALAFLQRKIKEKEKT